jgi:hypothetical protein
MYILACRMDSTANMQMPCMGLSRTDFPFSSNSLLSHVFLASNMQHACTNSFCSSYSLISMQYQYTHPAKAREKKRTPRTPRKNTHRLSIFSSVDDKPKAVPHHHFTSSHSPPSSQPKTLCPASSTPSSPRASIFGPLLARPPVL